MRVDCWRACILGHLRTNHGRAASYKPTSHNLQSMTVTKAWNTKYLTLMRADSGRAVMRARSRRAYARRLLARMHSWPPARKSRARCKLQTHQPQLTEYDCEETLEHKVSYTHARRFGTRCMVPWTHLREPIWENEDERKSEFTHFNLVIRLHKVQQLALHLSAILSCR